jgi:hypothetical protein
MSRPHHVGAFDEAIGRPEIQSLLALLIDRHEGDVDSGGCRRYRESPAVLNCKVIWQRDKKVGVQFLQSNAPRLRAVFFSIHNKDACFLFRQTARG